MNGSGGDSDGGDGDGGGDGGGGHINKKKIIATTTMHVNEHSIHHV